MSAKKRVVIIGAGFGGLKAALSLKKAPIELMIIDKTNHHLFQPLLYQVATAALSENNIATPLRQIFRNQKNASILMNEVASIDKKNQTITLADHQVIPFDYLIIATGSESSYFGNDSWKELTYDLKSLVDAQQIREHILWAFEMAEQSTHLEEIKAYSRFVLIGGGPTGVEMAGAIAEIAFTSMVKNYKNLSAQHAEIYLIEGADYILPTYPEKLSLQAQKDLEKMGVTVLTRTKATNITEQGVMLGDKLIKTKNIFWTAGNRASSLLKTLGTNLDHIGRAKVEADLSIPENPNIFIIGDAAAVRDSKYGTLPGLAPVAMQQGTYVGKLIAQNIEKNKRKPFRYFDKGTMATIGKAKAVAQIGKLQISGLFAWLAWSLIHIAYLITFRNRFIVMVEWFFLYLTGRRNASIITHNCEQLKDKIQL